MAPTDPSSLDAAPGRAPGRNLMAAQRSPYLQQHASNPVHWQPWGEAALAEARARDVPVLLSIGYAACHWCHVMAHESFEDAQVAEQMNAHFVCIKVDREERPDIDAVYMAATMAINGGRGGWPMTVFLTPTGEPFFAGTYFPPAPRHGMPSFGQLLGQVTHAWAHQRAALVQQGRDVVRAVQPEAPVLAPVDNPLAPLLQRALAHWQQRFDALFGGFTRAPKFLHTETLRLMLLTGERHQVPATLAHMAQGGLHDLVGGGFSRYSVDEAWHVPHFEKMLYDNALMATAYGEAARALGEPAFAEVAARTLDFVLRELRAPDGTFYSSLDADSEGEEGRFYVWTHADALAVLLPALGAEAAAMALDELGITEAGSWERGVSIPRLQQPLAPGGAADPEAAARQAAACAALLAHRSQRVRPGTDTKVLTGWNGLMLTALAEGCRAMPQPAYLEAGCLAADALWAQAHGEAGPLTRTPQASGPAVPAFLEDYAYLLEGLVALYEAGGPERCLQRAQRLAAQLVQRFADPATGALYDTPEGHEALLFRPREGHDGATPSPAATAAHALLRLSVHTGDAACRAAGTRALAVLAHEATAAPHAYGRTLLAMAFAEQMGEQAAFVAAPDAAGPGPGGAPSPWAHPGGLFAAMARPYAPNRVLAHGPATAGPEVSAGPGTQAWPLLAHREGRAPHGSVYLCRAHTCGPPLHDEAAVRDALR